MPTPIVAHPSDETLRSYVLGRLDGDVSLAVERHLETCPECRRRAAAVSSGAGVRRPREAGARPASAAPPSPATLPPGLAGHPDYLVLRELGRGAMGIVYLAENTLLGRLEVLKVVSSHLIARPGVLDGFLREIRATARLHHPNIVVVHAALRLGEGLVLAMEYVDGLDLARMVQDHGPLPVAQACHVAHQAAMGLQHAHERGMVHRDIKPANLMLTHVARTPTVKLLDFGLARVASEAPDDLDRKLAREGQTLGTPDFIAPEQIRDAHSADIRADIYSLGCTLYYLLTGGPPFKGDTLWDLYQSHFSMDASPLDLARPDVPGDLAALVAKMMAKDPSRRFQTPGEVARALLPFFEPRSEGPPAPNAAPSGAAAAAKPAEPPRPSTRTSTAPARAAGPPPLPPSARSPSRPPPSPSPSGSILEGLIDLGEPDPLHDRLLDTPRPSPSSGRAGRNLWPWAAAAAVGAIILLVVILVAIGRRAGVVKVAAPNGGAVEVDGHGPAIRHRPKPGGAPKAGAGQ